MLSKHVSVCLRIQTSLAQQQCCLFDQWKAGGVARKPVWTQLLSLTFYLVTSGAEITQFGFICKPSWKICHYVITIEFSKSYSTHKAVIFHQPDWKRVVVVSWKLILFGLNNQLVVSYKEENLMAFKSLFLKGYSGVDEDDYSIAVYTKQSVYDSLHYVIDQVCIFVLIHIAFLFFTTFSSSVTLLALLMLHAILLVIYWHLVVWMKHYLKEKGFSRLCKVFLCERKCLLIGRLF